MATPTAKKDFPIKRFKQIKEWEDWMRRNYSKPGVWLRFFKKKSGKETLTHNQALDVALCYGWIDGQAKPFDEESWLQKFTPRRAKSIWSKKNIERIERLSKEGRVQTSGMNEVEAAKKDGRWERAYDSPGNMHVPEDFIKEVSKDKKARAFFDSLNKANRFSIAWRLQTAKKPETREKRIQVILEMMKKGEKFH